MNISEPTYLIAELKGEVVDFVLSYRVKYNPERCAWPVDITLAGSSGVGTICSGQNLQDVIEELSPIIFEYNCSEVEFSKIESFPNTNIYYLKPKGDDFYRLHKAIVGSNVKLNHSPWPYNPHCTLVSGDESFFDTSVYSNLNIPKVASISCYSLYQPKPFGGVGLHQF